jgi:membrane dipeptidase
VYDFGLTADEEARAAELNERLLIIDLFMEHQAPLGYAAYTEAMTQLLQEDWKRHYDVTQIQLDAKRLPIRLALDGTFPLREWWDRSRLDATNLQVICDSFKDILEYTSLIQSQFDHFPWLVKALRAGDILSARASGRHAAFLNTENILAIEPDLTRLDWLYDFGVRMVGLTYNSMTALGSGCTEDSDAGLSRVGSRFVERLNELGMIVDIAHTGPRTGMHACSVSEAPVVVSHSSAAGILNHRRAKPDAVLESVASTGGVVGVMAMPPFLTDSAVPTIDHLLDHIEYIAARIGAEHVCIGSDWPVQAPTWVLREILDKQVRHDGLPDGPHSVNLEGFDEAADISNVTRGLVKRGFTDEAISAIMGENVLRVFEAVCG